MLGSRQALVLGGILLAINVILVLLSLVLPGIELTLMLILPAFYIIFYLKGKLVLYLEFLIANILLLSLIDLPTTFIYVFPSLVVSLVFGLALKYKLNGYYMIVLVSLFNTLLTYFTNYVIYIFTNVDVLVLISSLLGGGEITKLIFVFSFSIAQAIVIAFVTKNEIKKWNYQLSFDNIYSKNYIIVLTSLLIILIFSIFFSEAIPLTVILLFVISIPYFVLLFTKNYFSLLVLTIEAIAIFVTILLYGYLQYYPNYASLSFVFLLLVNIVICELYLHGILQANNKID